MSPNPFTFFFCFLSLSQGTGSPFVREFSEASHSIFHASPHRFLRFIREFRFSAPARIAILSVNFVSELHSSLLRTIRFRVSWNSRSRKQLRRNLFWLETPRVFPSSSKSVWLLRNCGKRKVTFKWPLREQWIVFDGEGRLGLRLCE